MLRRPIPFSAVLMALGVVLALAVVADLALRGLQRHPIPARWYVPGGDPAQGREAILTHGCGACHTIPGVRGANARVGPRLEGFREQIYIAGVLPNTPENLVVWIRNPRGINPRTAMPNLPVTESEARDIAAYLYSVD